MRGGDSAALPENPAWFLCSRLPPFLCHRRCKSGDRGRARSSVPSPIDRLLALASASSTRAPSAFRTRAELSAAASPAAAAAVVTARTATGGRKSAARRASTSRAFRAWRRQTVGASSTRRAPCPPADTPSSAKLKSTKRVTQRATPYDTAPAH
eukprot:scaffold482_cov247-Pinguiococcus_pyrenoidosus.AAC.24